MGEDIDGRADQYALAATAYHLLTGSQLFPHSNPSRSSSVATSTPRPPHGRHAPRTARARPCDCKRRWPKTPAIDTPAALTSPVHWPIAPRGRPVRADSTHETGANPQTPRRDINLHCSRWRACSPWAGPLVRRDGGGCFGRGFVALSSSGRRHILVWVRPGTPSASSSSPPTTSEAPQPQPPRPRRFPRPHRRVQPSHHTKTTGVKRAAQRYALTRNCAPRMAPSPERPVLVKRTCQ